MEESCEWDHKKLLVDVASVKAEIMAVNRLMTEIDKRNGAQFLAQERAVTAALAAAEKAVLVAERNAEKWRDNANEWRGAMTDKDRNFVTKATLWGYAVAMVGLILTLILISEKIPR